jgi:HAD superfamily hydrolase (TIGR01509 family)
LTIKAVIFDLDGTLVNFNLDIKSIRAEAIQFLNEQGYASSLFSLNESIFKTLEKLEVYMKNKGEEERRFTKIKKAVMSIADRHELKATQTTSLMPRVLETVRALKKMGLKMALFTIRGTKSTNNFIKHYDLDRFFDAVVTREDTVAVKPDSAHLEAVVKILDVEPSEAIVVGDSVLDMKCARKLDMIAVGVNTGLASPMELTQAEATYLISSITDLLTLVRQLEQSGEKNCL